MRSSCPEADIRMPVRTGRVSSREAERATREIVCTNASAGSAMRVSGDGRGQRGEVLGAQRAQVEGGRAADQLDVLLGGAQLERQLLGGQRAGDVEQQARGQNRRAGAGHLGIERNAQPDLHVGRQQLGGESSWAEIITPDSACTALRVEATRVTVCSWASSSAAERDSFMIAPSIRE